MRKRAGAVTWTLQRTLASAAHRPLGADQHPLQGTQQTGRHKHSPAWPTSPLLHPKEGRQLHSWAVSTAPRCTWTKPSLREDGLGVLGL